MVFKGIFKQFSRVFQGFLALPPTQYEITTAPPPEHGLRYKKKWLKSYAKLPKIMKNIEKMVEIMKSYKIMKNGSPAMVPTKEKKSPYIIIFKGLHQISRDLRIIQGGFQGGWGVWGLQ